MTRRTEFHFWLKIQTCQAQLQHLDRDGSFLGKKNPKRRIRVRCVQVSNVVLAHLKRKIETFWILISIITLDLQRCTEYGPGIPVDKKRKKRPAMSKMSINRVIYKKMSCHVWQTMSSKSPCKQWIARLLEFDVSCFFRVKIRNNPRESKATKFCTWKFLGIQLNNCSTSFSFILSPGCFSPNTEQCGFSAINKKGPDPRNYKPALHKVPKHKVPKQMIHSFIHFSAHSIIQSFIYSSACFSVIHSFIHSCNHSFIHSCHLSFVHAFIHFLWSRFFHALHSCHLIAFKSCYVIIYHVVPLFPLIHSFISLRFISIQFISFHFNSVLVIHAIYFVFYFFNFSCLHSFIPLFVSWHYISFHLHYVMCVIFFFQLFHFILIYFSFIHVMQVIQSISCHSISFRFI